MRALAPFQVLAYILGGGGLGLVKKVEAAPPPVPIEKGGRVVWRVYFFFALAGTSSTRPTQTPL